PQSQPPSQSAAQQAYADNYPPFPAYGQSLFSGHSLFSQDFTGFGTGYGWGIGGGGGGGAGGRGGGPGGGGGGAGAGGYGQ
ncbi:hypothetical protein HDV00_011389, partial [Rhizophlyctis rosea]